MNPAAEALPDDVAALRALLLEAWAERDAERAGNAVLAAERDRLTGQNDRLRHLIRQLQRMQFGKRSEKLDPEQFNLGLEDLEAPRQRPSRRRPTRPCGGRAPRSAAPAGDRCPIICRASRS
jgi:hypothetical protein